MELQQALVGIAETADNVTAHVISLEHLAHDLQQHLAGEKPIWHMPCGMLNVLSQQHGLGHLP